MGHFNCHTFRESKFKTSMITLSKMGSPLRYVSLVPLRGCLLVPCAPAAHGVSSAVCTARPRQAFVIHFADVSPMPEKRVPWPGFRRRASWARPRAAASRSSGLLAAAARAPGPGGTLAFRPSPGAGAPLGRPRGAHTAGAGPGHPQRKAEIPRPGLSAVLARGGPPQGHGSKWPGEVSSVSSRPER